MAKRARRADLPTAGEETMPIAALVQDPQNRRRHPERNLEMVTASLREVGAARSIVIDEGNTILAGNGVTRGAAAAGLARVRVIDADGSELIAIRRRGLTDAQKRALAIFDNRTAELAEWDPEQLSADAAAGLTFAPWFSADELAAVIGGAGVTPKTGATDPDDIPDLRTTDIVAGDLFALGAHRLLCGDATHAADVARVLDGRTPTLTQTDPPYAVKYWLSEGKTVARAGTQTKYRDPSTLQYMTFLEHEPAGFLVMTFPVDRHFFALADLLKAARYTELRELVWAKDVATFHPGATYQQQHEPILICRRAGVTLRDSTPPDATTLVAVPRPRLHDAHPTEKPIALWQQLMAWHTIPGDVVFDPFHGSGTTIMTGETIGRTVCAIDIEPAFVQAAIDRWEAFTGQTAEKLTPAPVRARRRKRSGDDDGDA